MGDSIAIGVAYRDQNLEGSTLTDCTLVGGDQTVDSIVVSGNATLGNATTDTLAFYGAATPQTQQAATAQAVVASTAPVSISATQWGFATSAQAASVIALQNAMRDVLVNLGLMKGSN